MRSRLAAALPGCAALLTLALAAGAGAHAQRRPAVHPEPRLRGRASSAPARLQVIQVEYRLILSRGAVRAGRVGLEAIDRGTDPHDLRLRRLGAGGEIIAPALSSGQRWSAVVQLKPGVYHLWCSLPEHAKLGMRATLRVVG
jgi:hypothetical protein